MGNGPTSVNMKIEPVPDGRHSMFKNIKSMFEFKTLRAKVTDRRMNVRKNERTESRQIRWTGRQQQVDGQYSDQGGKKKE